MKTKSVTFQDIEFSEEVSQALKKKKPILVLESTIITHGMPYPENYQTAQALEDICRNQDVVPATIAIFEGKIQIGLDDDKLRKLSNLDSDVEKVSIRDISYCLAMKKSGGTTVAATSYLASLVGLEVFATGGVGGVHRGVANSWDISADLQSLKNNPVIVVSAGAKAVLDIPKTLEILDSYSVPVMGYKTDDFPAFYSSTSGNKVRQIDSALDIAKLWVKHQELNFTSGFLIGNPISKKDEIPANIIEEQIQIALREVSELGISGKDITPFLLQRLYELTAGDSLKTNIALVKNNVSLGCQIASELKKL